MAMVQSDGGVFADINITPLTDIFLVLLIIFMVATAVTIESAAHVDLPKVQSAGDHRQAQGRRRDVHRGPSDLRQSGRSDQTQPAALQRRLEQDPDKMVVFQGDPAVILADMVRILDIAKTAGAQQSRSRSQAARLAGGGGGAPGASQRRWMRRPLRRTQTLCLHSQREHNIKGG